ncbi:MAG TPA: hypothetical protein VJT13_22435 [Xanthobacteraceae bacterium]|nr:hypothetical protein [Xanthobacteraceae bacterium]
MLLASLLLVSTPSAWAEPNDAQKQWAARVLAAKLKAQAAATAAREKVDRGLSPEDRQERERAKQAAAEARAEFVRRQKSTKP